MRVHHWNTLGTYSDVQQFVCDTFSVLKGSIGNRNSLVSSLALAAHSYTILTLTFLNFAASPLSIVDFKGEPELKR